MDLDGGDDESMVIDRGIEGDREEVEEKVQICYSEKFDYCCRTSIKM